MAYLKDLRNTCKFPECQNVSKYQLIDKYSYNIAKYCEAHAQEALKNLLKMESEEKEKK